MFGIGMPEMILILVVALIVIGPKKLPDLAKSLGKAMGEFKKATHDLKESIQIDDELEGVKSAFDDLEKDIHRKPTAPSGEPDENPPAAEAADGPPPGGTTEAAEGQSPPEQEIRGQSTAGEATADEPAREGRTT